jgi:hypothetical protein
LKSQNLLHSSRLTEKKCVGVEKGAILADKEALTRSRGMKPSRLIVVASEAKQSKWRNQSRVWFASSLRSLAMTEEDSFAIAPHDHACAIWEPAMAKMKAIEAAVRVLEKEGITCAFGVPGAAINPLYAALKARGSIRHVLARHVEGASHMADGYSRAKAGNIGVCIGTSGPAGTDMITGLYAATADSIPILCITGQAPRAKLYKEDFQAVDIETIAKPVTKWAVTVREPALVPMVFSRRFISCARGDPGRC